MSSPYRQNALVVNPTTKIKYRVSYNDPRKEDRNPTYHRFYWTAWLAAWWYCRFCEWGCATIQEKRS